MDSDFGVATGACERVDPFVPLLKAEAEHWALGLESDSRFKSVLPLWEFANGNISDFPNSIPQIRDTAHPTWLYFNISHRNEHNGANQIKIYDRGDSAAAAAFSPVSHAHVSHASGLSF
jgi:hypothetical protein